MCCIMAALRVHPTWLWTHRPYNMSKSPTAKLLHWLLEKHPHYRPGDKERTCFFYNMKCVWLFTSNIIKAKHFLPNPPSFFLNFSLCFLVYESKHHAPSFLIFFPFLRIRKRYANLEDIHAHLLMSNRKVKGTPSQHTQCNPLFTLDQCPRMRVVCEL